MNVTQRNSKGKKGKVFKTVAMLTAQEYEQLEVDVKLELIQALIPVGLMHVSELLQAEVEQLAGERYQREAGGKKCVRYGRNKSSVKLGGQKVPTMVPRVRNQHSNQEIALATMRVLKDGGELDETLLRRVLYGISCRNYEAAAGAVPGAMGLSRSTVSRKFIEATATKLRQFQERDLSELDLVALWIDGKSFAEDLMVICSRGNDRRA